MNIEQTYQDKFWSRVSKTPGGCWEYTGGCDGDGYGVIVINGKQCRTHRLSMILAGHDIPAGYFVCHHCDNPPCCNPEHLFIGTLQDNNRDMHNKGRHAQGEKVHLAKLTNDQARAIRAEARLGVRGRSGGGNIKELAERYNVTGQTIRNIAKNKTYQNI